jgi:hypothetical protein
MLGLFRKKVEPVSRPKLTLSGVGDSRLFSPGKLVSGHGEWNTGLEDQLYERLDRLGIPLNYHKDGANTPAKEASDVYGHNSVLGKNAIDEGILLRKMGCKHLYPRFLAILTRSALFTIHKPASREPYVSRRSDDLVDYVAVFSNVHRANDCIRLEADAYSEVIELTGEALLRRYTNHGLLINPGSPGATFAVPPEVVLELRGALGM